jgi:hypothetical protein
LSRPHAAAVPVADGRAAPGEADPEGFLKYERARLVAYD